MEAVKAKSIGKVSKTQICELVNDIAKNPEGSIKIYRVRRFDSYDGIWIEEVGLNQSIIMAPSDELFEKLKGIVLIKEKVDLIKKANLNVYFVKIPRLGVEFNAVMRDNDETHNDYAKAFIRWQVIMEVLSYFQVDFWSKLDDYLNKFFKKLIENGMNEEEAIKESYKEAYNNLKYISICR
ncbi:MAG: hypothetical protein QXF12_04715 [Candidatus Aenigmatarchaeota archaeon]